MGIYELFNLEGKVALVTGAAGGLGAAFAEALAEAGARVACTDINSKGVRDLAEKIGTSALAVQGDVTREDEVRMMVAEPVKKWGRLDVLVNNAGIADAVPRLVHQLPLSEWEKVVAVNLTGVFLCAKEALQVMVKQKEGKIINVASAWGEVGSASVIPVPAYNATKGAIINFTRELALEYASLGITINSIAPGAFRTGLGGGAFSDPAFAEAILEKIPIKKIGIPEDLKGLIVFMASEASKFITGHNLAVDGGYLAQ